MQNWKIESDPKRFFILNSGLAVVGVVLCTMFSNFDIHTFSDTTAGFLLGVLLIGIAVLSSFSTYKQTITVNPETREIIVESKSITGSTVQKIPFAAVVSARVGFIGKVSNFIGNTYYVSLTLADNTHYPLFLTGYYTGRGSAAVAEDRLRQLKSYL